MFTELAGSVLLLLLLVVTITDLVAYSEARLLQHRLAAIGNKLDTIEKHLANMNEKLAPGGRAPGHA